MKHYEYKGQWYSVNELSELCGVAPSTIRNRLRKGYDIYNAMKIVPVNEGVEQFCGSSCWEDWIGMSTNDLYKIYWKWCISNGYTTLQLKGFSRQIFQMYPNLKAVPTRKGNQCQRIIRER